MKKPGRIVVIAGPTGGGESTITNEIIHRFPSFKRLVTATTRKPRNNEKDGIDYYFFSKNKFKAEIDKGNIIEHTFIKNRQAYYGSYKPDLEKKLKHGYNVIINPDAVGAKYYKKNYRAITIFIKPDSLASIKKRLLTRDHDIKPSELKKRLKNAASEIKNESHFYDFIVINRQNELNCAIKEVIKIIKSEFAKKVDKTK
jgi:guanylate kinase